MGIAVVQSGTLLFAVEDFSAAVPLLGLDAQESRWFAVGRARSAAAERTDDARKTCEMDRGWAGQRPLSVLRYETSDLSRLPADIEQRVQGGKYQRRGGGRLRGRGAGGFTRFRIAILPVPLCDLSG